MRQALGGRRLVLTLSTACLLTYGNYVLAKESPLVEEGDVVDDTSLVHPDDYDMQAALSDALPLDKDNCDKMLGTKLWYRGECRDFDIISKAPRVYLHSEELFFPSSVPFFLANVEERDNHLVTKEPLGGPECYNPPFLRGQRPGAGNEPPVYTMIVPKKDNIIDVVYWTFYPYNRGKRVCVGIYSKIWNGCLGGYKTFGNHVGDWEHVTIRFVDLQPTQIYLSVHSFGGAYAWKDPAVTYEGDHPVIYAAQGSHGLYREPGCFTYRNLPNGDRLYDCADAGVAWDTWHNVKAIVYNRESPLPLPEEFSWLAFKGDWGNPKDGCGFYETIANQCLLNSGPTGPAWKGATQNDELD